MTPEEFYWRDKINKTKIRNLETINNNKKKWKEITLKRVEKHILWIEENVGDNRDPSKLRLSAEHLKVYENIGIYYQNFNTLFFEKIISPVLIIIICRNYCSCGGQR